MTQKDMKFRVKDEAHSEAIQKRLLEMGYAWPSGKKVKFTEAKFLTAYPGDKIIYMLYTEELFQTHDSTEHILTKDGRIVPLVDDDGYTYWEGGECPVPKGTLVDVKYRDGHVELAIPALVDNCVNMRQKYKAFSWAYTNSEATIVAYKLSEKQPAVEAPQETKQELPVLRPQKEMWLDRAAELLAAMSLCVDNQQKIPSEWIEELANVNVHL